MGRGQHNKSLEELASTPHRWFSGVQDFNGISNYRYGRNSKVSIIRYGAWRCDRIVAFSC